MFGPVTQSAFGPSGLKNGACRKEKTFTATEQKARGTREREPSTALGGYPVLWRCVSSVEVAIAARVSLLSAMSFGTEGVMRRSDGGEEEELPQLLSAVLRQVRRVERSERLTSPPVSFSQADKARWESHLHDAHSALRCVAP